VWLCQGEAFFPFVNSPNSLSSFCISALAKSQSQFKQAAMPFKYLFSPSLFLPSPDRPSPSMQLGMSTSPPITPLSMVAPGFCKSQPIEIRSVSLNWMTDIHVWRLGALR